MDIVTYAISKNVAEAAVSGVSSMSVEGTTLVINCVSGDVLRMTFPEPADGVSVVGVDIDANHMLSFILSDGNVIEAGQIDTIKGDKGDKGDKGEKGDKGDTGATGAQGLQGIQGEKGDKGDTGATGADGVSPILVANPDNTEDVYKLDITDKNGTFTTPNLVGRQGNQGIQGERGEAGPEGPQGIQGIQGIKGDKGEDGYPFLIYKEYADISEFDASHFPEIGLMFMINDGDPDANRPVYRYTGETANPYSHVTDLTTSEGLKGEKGDKGDTGEQGVPGVAGVDGENGITFTPRIGTVQGVEAMQDAAATVDVDTENKLATYNFWIPRGPAGQQGLPGEKGDPGETGEKGVDGTTYVPEIGTIETVDATLAASASVELDNDTHRAKFNFSIPKGVGVAKVEFTSSDMGDVAGLSGATDTYTITFTDGSTTTYKVYNGSDCDIQIDDEGELSETSVWSNQKTSEEIEAHSLPLVYDSGIRGNSSVEVYKLSNVTYEALGGENPYNLNLIISTRAGEEVELFGGKNDGGWLLFAKRNNDYSTKVLGIYQDGYDVYVRLATYFNYFRVYHKSGVLRDDFAVSKVDTIPSTATQLTIKECSAITTKSLALYSGYSGYITEIYDPKTKVVVYNVNIAGTFKGLGNTIATGFRLPKDAVSGADVLHTTLGAYSASSGNAMGGTAQYTRILVRMYSNPHLQTDLVGDCRILSTITYVVQ